MLTLAFPAKRPGHQRPLRPVFLGAFAFNRFRRTRPSAQNTSATERRRSPPPA
jgi:hypothetical protein